MRTGRHIIPDQRQHVLQHRDHAGFVALAGDDQHIAFAGRRHVAALQAERFGYAQAGTVQQRHHGGVARPYPRVAVFARAFVGVGKALGGCHRQRLRQALADLGGADRRQRADLALAFAFEKASERAQARQRPHQRASADIVGAAHCHERPNVGGLKRGEARQRYPRAPVLGEKRKTLPEVAGIGFQRLRRQPPLGAQMRQPMRDLPHEVISGGERWPPVRSADDDAELRRAGAHHGVERLARAWIWLAGMDLAGMDLATGLVREGAPDSG